MKKLLILLTLITATFATREQDSLALVAIKDANPGSTLNWDYTTGIDTWSGVFVSRDRVIRLEIISKSITSLPAEIVGLTSLEILKCDNNQLTSLPEEIGNLTSLRRLYCDNNQLASLPAEIGGLTSLVELDCSNNQLTSLPEEIGNLTSLLLFYCFNNQLTSLPAEIGGLTRLGALVCDNNQLTSLPAEIGGLTDLVMLYCFNNQLTSLPEEIGKLTSLVELYCDNNQLTSLPAEIGNLTSLVFLRCDNNQLHFDDLLVANSTPASSIDLFPQNDIEFSEVVVLGGAITSQIRGAESYKWFLTADLTTPVATTKEFTPSVTGEYVCVVKNSSFADDSLIQTGATVHETPVISSTPTLTATEDIAWSYEIIATDAETSTESLAYSILGEPSGMVLTGNSVSWTPLEGVLTSSEVTVTVSDTMGGSTTQKFIVTVTAVNDAPVITSTPTLTATEDVAWSYEITATDIDNSSLIYAISDEPNGMTITGNVVSWTPANGVTTSGEVTITVNDGELSDTQSFTISVDQSTAIIPMDITPQKGISDLLIAPNPVERTANGVHLIIPSELSGHWSITVYDALNNPLDEAEFEAIGGTTYTWDLHNRYGVRVASGSYVLIARFIGRDGQMQMFKRMIGMRQ